MRPRQEDKRSKFAKFMSAGMTVAEAARALNINRVTAHRWRDELGLAKRTYRKGAKETTI